MVFAKLAVFCFLAFLDTLGNEVQANFRDNDYRIWNEQVLSSPEGRLLPLSWTLFRFIRELWVQKTVRDTNYGVKKAKA